MANPPRTHTTETIPLDDSHCVAALLPPHWEPGTRVAVVDLTHIRPGLTPNLGGAGTYSGTLDAVLEEQRHNGKEWQARRDANDPWQPADELWNHRRPSTIVQARPAPQPPTERIPWHQAVGRKLVSGDLISKVESSAAVQHPGPYPLYVEMWSMNHECSVRPHLDLDGTVEVVAEPECPKCGDDATVPCDCIEALVDSDDNQPTVESNEAAEAMLNNLYPRSDRPGSEP